MSNDLIAGRVTQYPGNFFFLKMPSYWPNSMIKMIVIENNRLIMNYSMNLCLLGRVKWSNNHFEMYLARSY